MQRRGIPSARALAERAGVSVTAVLRLMHREGRPSEQVISDVAKALGLTPQLVRELAKVPAGEEDPFVLPPEANRLNRRQRAAVVEIVRLLLEGQSDVVPLSAATGRPAATERRGLKVAAKREKDPDDGGPG